MRPAFLSALTIAMLSSSVAAALAEDTLRVELNVLESAANRCRTSFMVRNNSEQPVEALKLDLVILNTDQVMQRRMIVDLAPIRAKKAVMRTFEVEIDCKAIGSILVNDVPACEPNTDGDCMKGLGLSSRVPNVQLFK